MGMNIQFSFDQIEVPQNPFFPIFDYIEESGDRADTPMPDFAFRLTLALEMWKSHERDRMRCMGVNIPFSFDQIEVLQNPFFPIFDYIEESGNRAHTPMSDFDFPFGTGIGIGECANPVLILRNDVVERHLIDGFPAIS
jgi:hypothetical protein